MIDPIDLIDALKARSDRREIQRRRYDLLIDNCAMHVEHEIDQRFTQPENRRHLRMFLDLGNNSYRATVEKVASVYKEPARRRFAKESDNALWRDALADDMDLTMESVNRIALACNECFVRPVVRNDGIDLDIITPDQCEVASDGIWPTQIAYVVEDGYVYVDPQVWLQFNFDGHIVGGDAHGIGMLPVSVFRRARPAKGFWLGTLGEDLVAAYFDQVINRSWLNMLSYFQGHKELARVPSLNVPQSTRGQAQAPAGPHVIHDGDMRVLDMRTDLEPHLRVNEGKLQRTAANWGISADVLNQSKFGSGLERLLAHSGLNEVRLATIKLFRPAERYLMAMSAAVWNASAPAQKFSDLGDLDPRIDYGEPRLIESPKDSVEILSSRMELGLASVVDQVMADDPDIQTREEAIEKIKRNLEENSVVLEARRRYSVPDDIAAALGAVGGTASGAARQPPTDSEADANNQTEETE